MAIQDKFSSKNVIYKITSDVDLEGGTLTVPAGCTLDFQGGSINNGTVRGNGAYVSGETSGCSAKFEDVVYFTSGQETALNGMVVEISNRMAEVEDRFNDSLDDMNLKINYIDNKVAKKSDVDKINAVLQISKETVESSEFERTVGVKVTVDGAVTKDNSCFISKPILFAKGDEIKISVSAYPSMAVIAETDEEGGILSVLEYGGGGDHASGSKPFFTYFHTIKKDGYYVVSGYLEDTTLLSYTRSFSKVVDNIEKREGAANTNFLPICQFVNLEADAANGMENWTGQQIIDNIYEPLRLAYPQYISRKSIGKSGDYDIWVYEFNNSVEEWFGLDNHKVVSSDIILPSNGGLTSKQAAIKKETFSSLFSIDYKNLYPLSVFAVRKPVKASVEDRVIDGENYVVLSCDENIKISNGGIDVYWTEDVKTYDQHAMIISGTHADENAGYLGTALSLKYLVEHHSENVIMDYIFNNVKLSVVPILNMWGANQEPKVRTAQDGSSMNDWYGSSGLNAEQKILSDYVSTIKDELSYFIDCHTAEWWSNYGYVFAIPYPHAKMIPAIVSTANFLCKHWFPNEVPLNWNIGKSSSGKASQTYMMETFGIDSATVEFCGQDLIYFSGCARWDSQYMTYAVENFLNLILAITSMRIKDNSKGLIENKFFTHTVMS